MRARDSGDNLPLLARVLQARPSLQNCPSLGRKCCATNGYKLYRFGAKLKLSVRLWNARSKNGARRAASEHKLEKAARHKALLCSNT